MSWRRGSGHCGPKVLQCFKQAACEPGPITQVQGGETAVRSHLTPIGESRANAGTLTGLTEPPDGGIFPVEVDRRRGRAKGRTPSTLSTICPLECRADLTPTSAGSSGWCRRGRPGWRRPTGSRSPANMARTTLATSSGVAALPLGFIPASRLFASAWWCVSRSTMGVSVSQGIP